jgi:hypothetical protein
MTWSDGGGVPPALQARGGVPRRWLRLEGSGLEASVQDADKPVRETPKSVIMFDFTVAELVVVGAGAGDALSAANAWALSASVFLVTALGGRPVHGIAALAAQAWNVLAGEAAEGRRTPVLVIDEAHLLAHDQLESIRLMTNHDMDSTSLILI